MKKEELQIGDWVWYDPNVFIDDEYETAKACHYAQINDGEDIDLADEGCYCPVPLTAEMLMASGFDATEHGLALEYGNVLYNSGLDRQYILVWFHHDGTVRGIEINNDISTNLGVARMEGKCRFVHEFQHALRCCSFGDLADNLKMN